MFLLHPSYWSLCVRITQKGTDNIVGVTYSSPGKNLADFNQDIDMLLDILSKTHTEIFMLDDFHNMLNSQDHFLEQCILNSRTLHHYLSTIL